VAAKLGTSHGNVSYWFYTAGKESRKSENRPRQICLERLGGSGVSSASACLRVPCLNLNGATKLHTPPTMTADQGGADALNRIAQAVSITRKSSILLGTKTTNRSSNGIGCFLDT